ncbi:hypothetical protein DL96DRAFT_1111320 [Flagelloscypha sp. PMI_526]|nr:hypothetical protein DL96DRAFT_1111320 [Flagelloscypha sp. PMI_526]
MNQAGWRNMSVEKDRVTRPRNPYILFRTIYVKNLQTLYPKEYNRFDQKEGSRDIGRIWRSLSDSEQKPFNDLAEREKQEHKAFHPTYRWADRFKNAKPSKKRQLAEREREGGEKPHLMLRGPDPDELAKRQAWANGLEYSPNWFDGRSSRPPQSLPRHDDKTPNWVQLEACGRKESFGGGDSCVKSTEGKVRVIVANYDAEKSKERKTSTSSVRDDDVQMGDTSTPQKEKHVTVEVEMEDATSSRSSSGSIPPNPLKRPRSVTPDDHSCFDLFRLLNVSHLGTTLITLITLTALRISTALTTKHVELVHYILTVKASKLKGLAVISMAEETRSGEAGRVGVSSIASMSRGRKTSR